MKVRHKFNPGIVREVRVDKLGQWIDAEPMYPDTTLELDQNFYERVPSSPTWRDVTAECEAVKDQACTVYGEGPDFPLLQVKVYRHGTYRLVKTEQGFRVERKDP